MRRWHAVGDPQTTFDRFLEVLRQGGLLDDRARLRDDVGLVSVGDHFDFHPGERSLAETSRDGTNILGWLAAHPPEQVVILMGNHDAARVMELAYETDESFSRARELAERSVSKQEFTAAFPRIPTPDIARRDYASFAEHQRDAVQELLLAGRLRLGAVGHRGRRPMLLTHAGVTRRELAMLGLDERSATPTEIGRRLDARLRDAIDRVRDAWLRGERAALDLTPLHHAGGRGEEGGGLLYHRPSTNAPDAWSGSGPAPRRFDPRTALPRGLVQVCGHTGHHKCHDELFDTFTAAARARKRGGLRTLRASDDAVSYDVGIHEPLETHATMYLIDIEMNRRDLEDTPLFALDDVTTD